MIRHVVMLRFRPEVSDETKAGLYRDLAALKAHLPGMMSFVAGPNVSIEPEVMHGWRDAFVVDFADRAARDAYVADPAHRAVGARLVAHLQDGAAGVTVVDLEI